MAVAKIDSTIISQPSLPIFTVLTIIDSINCYGDNTGTANASVTGGVSPYSLVWSSLLIDTISLDPIATNLTKVLPIVLSQTIITVFLRTLYLLVRMIAFTL